VVPGKGDVRSSTPPRCTNRRHTSGRVAVAVVVEDCVADDVVNAKALVAVEATV
jgi:hypothetical protein